MKIQIPRSVFTWLRDQGEGEVESLTSVSGGSINQAFRLVTNSKTNFFLKINQSCPPDMFPRESEGLHLLDINNGPRVPKVHLFGDNFLLLEYLPDGKMNDNYWTEFGQNLASVHQISNSDFGLAKDNYIGSTAQNNLQTKNGFEFFADQRLIYQGELAAKNAKLNISEVNLLVSIAHKLKELIPEQNASLIHGDLWSGNLIVGPKGEPVIIDPAVHYGWPEAELAMTTLFGSLPPEFYASYENSTDVEFDWRKRSDIYNLYHLLNHLNIFGMGYHGSVLKILKKYA